MISSAPRLKMVVELVTNASITASSTPELASFTSSATGPAGLMDGSKGFWLETSVAFASVSASTGSDAELSVDAGTRLFVVEIWLVGGETSFDTVPALDCI
jgi:hypothetical protein